MKKANQFVKTKLTMGTAVLLVFLATIVSCDSFVEVEMPSHQLTAPVVFEDKTTADAAMTTVFASLRNSGLLTGMESGISNRLGCYADELDYYGNVSNPTNDFYNNTVLPLNTGVQAYWNTAYNQIYGANAVYEGVSASSAILTDDANRLKGEALFARALLHFYLTNMYGPIPYITTTDYQINSKVKRKQVNEIYNLIIADLENAIALVPEEYYGTGRARPNKATLFSLLSRTYLYKGEWAEASNAASAVLNQTALYADEPNIENIFLKNCTETIWQFPPHPEGKNTFEAATFTVLAAPPSTSALSENLVNAFSENDLRKTNWIGTITGNNATFYYPHKYKQNNSSTVSKEYSIVFRTAELYLIRAEARAQQGFSIIALEDLNHVRQGAGLPPLMGLNQTQILEAIALERRLELFTEFGHRFFDLKRTGMLDATLNNLKPTWSTNYQLLPLPQNELSANPNLLPQNQGY